LDPCILSSFDFLASHPTNSPESLNIPPSKKPIAPALTVVKGIDLNISVPALMEQFVENPSASTAMDLPPKINAKVDSSVRSQIRLGLIWSLGILTITLTQNCVRFQPTKKWWP
jgi:hypothetical protein